MSTVIAGIRTARNVKRNAATMDGRRLARAQKAKLTNHQWERNWYLGN